jgi:hypothetical protein
VRSARSVRRARWPAASGTVSGSPRRLRCGRPRRSPHRTSRLGRGSGTGRPRARRRPSRPMIDNSATARRTPEPARKLGWRLARSVTSSLPSRWAPTRRVNAGLGCATSSRLRTLSLARSRRPSALTAHGAPSLLALRAGAARGASHTARAPRACHCARRCVRAERTDHRT